MPHWDFKRSVTSMRLMAELAEDHGLPLRSSLEGTRVTAKQLSDPSTMVSGQQELRLIRNLVEALPNVPALGIEAGRRYHFTSFGALGFAMVSSPTPRGALDVALRHFQLTYAFTKFSVADRGDETIVTLDGASIPEGLRRFIIERDSAALITVQRDLFSLKPILRRISLAYAAPPYVKRYVDFFGVEPQFGSPDNVAVLDRTLMLERLPQANSLARQTAEEQCRKLLDDHRVRSGLSLQVRNRLIAGAAQMPDMDTVADDLHTTPRTLRRRLLEEGTTFAELRDEVRMALAEELLSGPRLSVEQIAERLGYAEATSFITAFKRWRGRTPHAYRLMGS